jgi:hypothetical protein
MKEFTINREAGMKNHKDITGRLLILVALLGGLVAACSSPTPQPTATQPVPSPTLAATPTSTATLTEISATPTLTVTPTLTATPALTNTPTQLPSNTPIPATVTPTTPPTPTATKQPQLAADGLKVWTYPENKTKYGGNEGFGLAIYYKNVGSLTWQPGFMLKLVKHVGVGEVTVQPQILLDVTVPSGGKVEFDLWAFGSEHPGQHTWYFQLYTDTGKLIPGSEVKFTFTAI